MGRREIDNASTIFGNMSNFFTQVTISSIQLNCHFCPIFVCVLIRMLYMIHTYNA